MMYVNHKIHMNLIDAEAIPTLEMVQHDQLSRQVELSLYCGEEQFLIPEDAGVMIHYLTAAGQAGVYDALPDGMPAWKMENNRLTVSISPEILAEEGTAAVSARLIQGIRTLNTFTFLIRVHKGIPTGKGSEVYRLCWYLAAPPVATAGQFLAVASVDENGIVTGVTAVDAPEIDTSFGIWGQLYAQKLRITGSFSTDSGISVSFNNNRLQKVGEPQADTDGVNKAYVDRCIAEAMAQK